MRDLHVPDISQHQAKVDMALVGPAVILRAHNGHRLDATIRARQVQARAHCYVIGYYGYCIADRNPVDQAREMAGAVGELLPGEFCVVDIEEGTLDQSARAEAYAHVLDQVCGGHAWIYSGESFAHDHLTHVSGRRLWIAAYRKKEPTAPHALWQHTDAEPHPGIGACDCSLFHGTVAQLRDLITPASPAPSPVPTPAPDPADQTLEVTMRIIYAPDRATVAITDDGHVKDLKDNAVVNALAATGVPVRHVTTTQFDLALQFAKTLTG